MKIFFQSIGVLTTYNIDLPNYLCELGADVYTDSEVNLSRLVLLGNKLIGGYRPKLKFMSLLQLILSKKVFKDLEGFDVLHLNAKSKFCEKILTMSKRPKIFVLHEAPLQRGWYEKFKDFVDVFVAPSEFTATNEACKIGYKPVVIHHGVNTFLFNTTIPKCVAREKLGIPPDSRVVLWNDRISPEKDLLTFLQAIPTIAREVPNTLFYIKGRACVHTYFKPLRKLIRALKRNFSIKMHIGWISHKRLPLLYRSADLFVRTSLYESFGLGVIESMACGVPVVAPDYATFPEILGDAGIYFHVQDSEDLAIKVITLLKHDEVAKEKAEEGLERIRERFTWGIAAKKYMSLYGRLIS